MNKFTLRILWLKQNVGFSIDHIVQEGYSPLTSYFFWPSNDAWMQIKKELESKPWISHNNKIDILNKVTKIINYWRENNLDEAQEESSGFIFYGN